MTAEKQVDPAGPGAGAQAPHDNGLDGTADGAGGQDATLAELKDVYRTLREACNSKAESLAAKRVRLEELCRIEAHLQASVQEVLEARRFLIRELGDLDDEKVEQEGALVAAAGLLRARLEEIEKAVRQVEFLRGELEALQSHVASVKATVPGTVRDKDRLDDKIAGTAREFKHIADHVRNAELEFKLAYYQKRQELRRGHGPF